MLSRICAGLCLVMLSCSIALADAPATQPAGEQRTTASGLTIIETKPLKEARTAQKGDVVWVNYTGTLKSNGHKFDSSLDKTDPNTNRPTPLSFVLGDGKVIKGWDEGLVGMKVGEKRQLIIPPALGWADRGTPDGQIPPNATVVFDVELVGIYRSE